MNKMLYDEVIPTLPLDKDDLLKFAAAVSDRFNNPFVNHELMSISLNSTSKWKARNMPSFLEYIKEEGRLPECLTMSLAAYIAFYSNDIQALTDAGLVCKRPAGNEYTVSDDRWVLEFYYDQDVYKRQMMVLIIFTKMHAFPSLIISAILIAVLAMPFGPEGATVATLTECVSTVTKGFGNTMASIGVVIGFGCIMGIFLEKSGAAKRMALTILKMVGVKNCDVVLGLTGFVVDVYKRQLYARRYAICGRL